MNLAFSTPILMESSLSPGEIVRRLQHQVGSPIQFFTFLGKGPKIIGKVRTDRFWLRYSTFYFNSFQRRLALFIDSDGSGSRLRGRFACSNFTRIFSGIWIGFVAMFNLIWLVALAQGEAAIGQDGILFKFLPISLLIFGVLLFLFGFWLSSWTEANVIKFVEQVLDARMIDIPSRR